MKPERFGNPGAENRAFSAVACSGPGSKAQPRPPMARVVTGDSGPRSVTIRSILVEYLRARSSRIGKSGTGMVRGMSF